MIKKRMIICIFFLMLACLTACGRNAPKTHPAGFSREENARLLACRDLPANPAIRDYSDLLEKTGYVITDVSPLDDNRLLLAGQKQTDDSWSCAALVLDLRDSSLSFRGDSFLISSRDRQDVSGPPLLRILSIEPLVLYDRNGCVIYTPEKSPVTNPIPEESRYWDVTVKGGRIFLCGWSGFISEFTDDHTFKPVWTLNSALSSMTLMPCADENTLQFQVSGPVKTGDTLYLHLDIRDWSESYYTLPSKTFWVNYADRDSLISLNRADKVNTIELYHIGGEEHKTIKIPPEINEDCWLDTSEHPLTDHICVFYTRIDPDGITGLYVADLSKLTPAFWSPLEETPFEMPEFTPDILADRVKQIEERYGLLIRFGDETRDELWGYKMTPTEDITKISIAMDTLEDALSLYPDDFFRNLEEGFVRDIYIYFTGALLPVDTSENISNAAGITCTDGGVSYMAYDIESYTLTRGTVVHEFSHIVDLRVKEHDWNFEEKWAANNPEDFDYYYAYVAENGEMIEFAADSSYTSYGPGALDDHSKIYLIDTYSKTYPTEDRARVWEYLMNDAAGPPDYYDSPALQAKLTLYFQSIRDCMDTSTWPARTEWEKRLAEAKAK